MVKATWTETQTERIRTETDPEDGMFRRVTDLWWFEGIISWEVNGEEEHSALIRTVGLHQNQNIIQGQEHKSVFLINIHSQVIR